MKSITAIGWKLQQLWLKARCSLSSSKAIVYPFNPEVNFVAHLEDLSSHDIYIKRNYESKEIQWCSKWLQSGDTFVDCGANIGFYSACLAQLGQFRIHAIEGNQTCYERCLTAFKLLSLHDITLVHAILHSDSEQSLFIPDMPGQEGLQHICTPKEHGASCQTLTLDELAQQEDLTPSLIKVDCEGAETAILKGATALLEETRPAWLIEINDHALTRAGTSRGELFTILKQASYRLFHISSAFADYPLGQEIDSVFQSWSFNMAAIPDDRSNLERWMRSIA